MRRLVVLLGFWAIQTSAHATLDEAISRALEAIDPYAKQGYVIRLDDEWGGDLGVKERKAIPEALLGGNDYWFCIGTDVDDARIAVHVCDSKGKWLENTAWQKGRFAAARILILATATYYIIVEVTSSPVERTHWAMLYGSKRIGLQNAMWQSEQNKESVCQCSQGPLDGEALNLWRKGSKSMNGLETNTLHDNSRRVAQAAQDLIKTTATYPSASPSNLLKGKKGLVTGVANGNSNAYGAARAFHEAGAEIMLTCRRPKTEQYVRPLLCELGNPALLLCDVCDEEQLQAVFERSVGPAACRARCSS